MYRGILPEFSTFLIQYISYGTARIWAALTHNKYIYMYIRIAFSIELRLRVSLSLRSLANYCPSPLAQKPSNGVLASGDPITPSNTVKYHPSSNTLISTEQQGGVRNKYIYIYLRFLFVTPDSVSLARQVFNPPTWNIGTYCTLCSEYLPQPQGGNISEVKG